MSAFNARLNYLFNSYYHQTATQQERDELFEIINSSANDAELTALIHEAWNTLQADEPLFDAAKSMDMLNNILQNKSNPDNIHPIRPPNKNQLWLKVGVAAAMMVFVGFGAYVLINQHKTAANKRTQARLKPVPAHDVLPGGNKAVLTLANGKTITLDSAKNGLLANEGNAHIKKTHDGQLVYEGSKNEGSDAPAAINTVSTPRGGQYQLVLDDGSKVWLNSASSLSFPATFKGATREVEITGEAYFEVAKNAKMPFKVKVNNTVVEVLGTHFNIMAYNDEDAIKTTLLEGSVKISNKQFSGLLKPGQQALLKQNGPIKITDEADADDAIAWKEGIFQFRDAGIEAIMRQAARWYDVQVSYTGKVPVKEFTGRISRNVKASELMGMLKYMGVNFKIEDKHITVLP
ncbi:FecR family protein [Mucilaginibacter sp. OK283]|jgi:ferric-dicitrate binding protein FerR (iron transport regulator)|uniref:FecR family protein n=1 Tax=Mucilaginibacter sp. OK283 TaxID=1881049 RepID=UPI0008B66046|nr:FecR family protein [Mucilaginibacter sp. OK283]SEP33388.1 FecR family protein [Mucilaginibacter sp. OK283]